MLIRAHDITYVENFFTSHRIARLRPEHLKSLWTLIKKALPQALETLSLRDIPTDVGLRDVAEQRAEVAMTMLVGIVDRLDGDQLEEVMVRALSYYEHASFRSFPTLSKYLRGLFEGLFRVLPDKKILEFLPRLMSLSIPVFGESGMVSADKWPEPSQFIPHGLPLPIKLDDSIVSSLITRLYARDDASGRESRIRAIQRLTVLSRSRRRPKSKPLDSRPDSGNSGPGTASSEVRACVESS